LSVQLFWKQQKLEELRPAILSVLRAYSSTALLYGDNDWAVLQAHNIYRPAKYIPLTGPLSLQFKGTEQGEVAQLHLESHLPSISLPDMLCELPILSPARRALVTVENLTSFNELLFVRPLSVIVVFTSGFACSGLIIFSPKFVRFGQICLFSTGKRRCERPPYLAHLRSHLRNVQSLGMDIETFEAYRACTQSLTASDQTNLRSLIAILSLLIVFH